MILIFLVLMFAGIILAFILMPGLVVGTLMAQKKATKKAEVILTAGKGNVKEIDWCIKVLGNLKDAGANELARRLTILKLEIMKEKD